MLVPQEEQWQQIEQTLHKIKKRITKICEESSSEFLSWKEVGNELDRYDDWPWVKRYWILRFSFNSRRDCYMDIVLRDLITEGKIDDKFGVYGIKK